MAKVKYRVVVDKHALPILLEDTLMSMLLGDNIFFSCTDVIPSSPYLNMKIQVAGELECDVYIRNEFVLYYTSWVNKNAPIPGFAGGVQKGK